MESRQLGFGFGRVEGVEITDVGRKWLADNFPEPGSPLTRAYGRASSARPRRRTGAMEPGTVSYYRVDTPATATSVQLRFASSTGNALPSSLRPQIAIFRLPR